MTQRQGVPLFKVTRPEGKDVLWEFQPKGEGPWLMHEGKVPDRVKKALGRFKTKYLYLLLNTTPTCDCDHEGYQACGHPVGIDIEYVSTESSSKKCQW